MRTYQNNSDNSTFEKTIGVELGEGDTVAVTVTINENGSQERLLPQGRELTMFELWAIDDVIEADAELQAAITEREENYARSHQSQCQQVCHDWESAIEGCRRV